MDPDDLAALNRLLGRASPTPDPSEPTMGQLLAQAIVRHGRDGPENVAPSSGAGSFSPAMDRKPTPQELADALQAYGRPAPDSVPTRPASRQVPGGAGMQLLSATTQGPVPANAAVGGPPSGMRQSSKLIGDANRVAGDALHVTSGLNSKWMFGGYDTPTAQSDFDRTNAAIDRTVAILQSSNDSEAQAAIERLNNAGYQLATQASEAGLKNTNTQSLRRALEDQARDAGKDAMGSAFGDQFGP